MPKQRLMRLLIPTFCLVVASLVLASKVPVLRGAGSVFTLHDLTVVYPASPAEDVETNRLSAERRAAFLREAYGVDADVAADDALHDDRRSGNLLLLGWNNRLLESLSPVLEGRQLLGGIDVGEDEQLLFFCVSPFNEASRVYVWTQIDPEWDRFSPIPFQGSDWAVFRNYVVVEQGNFADSAVWPPQRNELAEMDHRPLRSPPAVRQRSAHYNLRDTTGTLSDADVAAILEAREAAWASAVGQLGAPPAGFRIELYVYTDGAQKAERSGVPDLMHSVSRLRQLHMTAELARSPDPHEDIHILARALLGPCYSTALHEGLAIALERPEERVELDMFAAGMLEQGKLPTVDDLMDEERNRRLSKSGLGFPASGLFVLFLRSSLDADGFRRAYTIDPPTTENLARAAGTTVPELEKGFRAWLVARGDAAKPEMAFRKAEARAAELRAAGDHAGAAEAYAEALQVKPDDLQTLYRLALARMRAGEYDSAEKPLQHMLEISADPELQRFLSLIHYELGRLYDLREQRDRALAEYRLALELPDHRDAHERARKAMETPERPEGLQ